jgi:proteic killer suppression protein
MIGSFGDRFTEDIFHGNVSTKTTKFPRGLIEIALRKLDMLNAALKIEDLPFPSGNRKKWKGNKKDFYSIRINDQYRIVFKVMGNKFEGVKIDDYHS